MKVMSFNVKRILFEDLFFMWKRRYKKVVLFINKENPDILGMQEITRKGNAYLKKNLSNYNIVGDSRHSKFLTDEYNPILIKKVFKISSSKTYSLSENINKLGTITEKDNYPRICVIVHAERDNNRYMIVNTHIDNSDSDNKSRLLNILKNIIKKEQEDDEFIIMMGDYNMTMGNKSLVSFSKNFLSPFKNYTEGTFPSLPNLKPLDHIFLDKRLNVLEDRICNYSNDDGFLSDHNPISCKVSVKR